MLRVLSCCKLTSLSEPKWVESEIALLATGSEVEIALQAKAKLADEGIGARVVSSNALSRILVCITSFDYLK